MTCYSRVMQDEEVKRQQVEKLKQDKVEFLKQHLREEYARQDRERDRKAREAAEEQKRLDIIDTRKKRADTEEEMRKRMTWGLFYLGKGRRVVGEERQIFTPLDRKKKPLAAPQQKEGERATYAAGLKRRAKKGEEKKALLPTAPSGLELSAEEDLPKEIPVGQGEIKLVLLGRNSSARQFALSLKVLVLDSQHNQVSAKAEPRTLSIAPGEQAKITVTFGLPADAAPGELKLSALLQENAVYIDKPSARSNTLELSSVVKGAR